MRIGVDIDGVLNDVVSGTIHVAINFVLKIILIEDFIQKNI